MQDSHLITKHKIYYSNNIISISEYFINGSTCIICFDQILLQQKIKFYGHFKVIIPITKQSYLLG